jgi:hypothetical protein
LIEGIRERHFVDDKYVNFAAREGEFAPRVPSVFLGGAPDVADHADNLPPETQANLIIVAHSLKVANASY